MSISLKTFLARNRLEKSIQEKLIFGSLPLRKQSTLLIRVFQTYNLILIFKCLLECGIQLHFFSFQENTSFTLYIYLCAFSHIPFIIITLKVRNKRILSAERDGSGRTS